MANDLNFHNAYTPPAGNHADLNFSLNPDGVVTNVTVSLAVSPPTLHIETAAAKAKPVVATVTLTLSTVQSLQLIASYDNRVFRGPSHSSGQGYEMAVAASSDKGSGFKQAANLKPVDSMAWPSPLHVGNGAAMDWQQANATRKATGQRYEAAAPLTAAQLGSWKDTLKRKVRAGVTYEAATPLFALRGDSFEYPPHVKVVKVQRYEAAKTVTKSKLLPAGPAVIRNRSTRLPWEEGKLVQWGLGEQPPVIPQLPPTYDGTGKPLDFRCPWLDYAGNDIKLNFALDQCPPVEPPDGNTVIVPVKRVYIVINNVLLRRVDGNVELPTFSLSMSIDADSWTWGFNAALPDTTLDAIEPGTDGTPVELEAVINGTAYRVLAEQISRERTFGRAAIRVSGKGKSAMLGAPYAPVQNFSNSQARTAQQLMNDALTINGASIGWTVNWGLTDWLVPAGAWSHQGSYITALNAIAGAAGAYIQPDPSLKKLNVLSRYPTAPWNWGSVTPDFELPADVTTRESIEWLQRPAYNRVFVSGEGQGVLGQVTRTGTAGDILAPMVTDALITHADAARQRGLSILGDTGRQAHLSLRLPVLAETGVIQPGKFVRYVDGGVTRLGIVRSTAVDVSMPEVWQTIGVETHVATA
ncbi:hypothetical protein RA280_14450 [Cupriavidus sp. CV2]|uniref:hypothetical protein n=1 Tax=Cupriavidus ulmosensis TaxID=3065913 RepID=UPI00296B0526|nr:hypothetical protein [Cupriavidus sp. CV2]MDW3682926.1 hypothetical protein [Cupriavidus sp. CV2]